MGGLGAGRGAAGAGVAACGGERLRRQRRRELRQGQEVTIGLITKTDTNPFFVKMKEGAQKAAEKDGVKLLTAAGKYDGDNASQVTAIENMVDRRAPRASCYVPSDTKAIVPAIKKARDQGVTVIALDTPTEPQNAADALFATNNFKAGELIGQYAKAAMAGKTPKIAMIDLSPGITVGDAAPQRLPRTGFGIPRTSTRRSSGVARTRRATRPRARPRWRTACRRTRTSTSSTRSTSRPASAPTPR